MTCNCTAHTAAVTRVVEPLVTHVDTYWKCPAQHNEVGTQCCCHDSAQHPPLTRATLSTADWLTVRVRGTEVRSSQTIKLLWHGVFMKDGWTIASDLCQMDTESSQRAHRLMCYQSHIWQRALIISPLWTSTHNHQLIRYTSLKVVQCNTTVLE